MVQVIGEISNKAAAHRKFVQTFVLAEQPKGYFVLNDIFRYILEDEEEEMEDGEVAGEEGMYNSKRILPISYPTWEQQGMFFSRRICPFPARAVSLLGYLQEELLIQDSS